MSQPQKNFQCSNCERETVKRAKFPYPSKVRINPENNKVRLVVGPLHIFSFVLWIILFLIFSLSYIAGLENTKSIIFSSVVILITSSLLIYVLLRMRKTVSAGVYKCINCGTVWLLKDKEIWESAVPASGKFLKNFDNGKIYKDDKNEKTWKCPNCGEMVPEDYGVCWKCSREVNHIDT